LKGENSQNHVTEWRPGIRRPVFFNGAAIVQEDEEQEQDEYSQYSSSLKDNQRNGATRGRGGARGRGATGRNPNQTRGITQSKDAEGYNQYQQGQDGRENPT
jgi:hypothetical protein